MISNLLLLTGEDTFRLSERARFYRRKFVEKYPDGEVQIFSSDATMADLENATLTPNLFGGKRLIVCEEFWDPDKFEQAQKCKFFANLPEVSDYSTILCLHPKLDKRQKLSKFLLAESRTETFAPLEEPELVRWIETYTKANNGHILHRNAQLLVKRCGHDLWNLSSEIKKLISAADDSEITETNITQLTLPKPEIEIWDFLQHLSKKDATAALKSFKVLMMMGQSPHQIFPMLQREIRIHAQIRAGLDKHMDQRQIAAATGLHPFVLKKTVSLTRNFSQPQIADLYESLFQLDRSLKTGGMYMTSTDTGEFELAIEKFIVRVCEGK